MTAFADLPVHCPLCPWRVKSGTWRVEFCDEHRGGKVTRSIVARDIPGGVRLDVASESAPGTPVDTSAHVRHDLGRIEDVVAVPSGQVDAVCQHGTALDVHCCGCHSGFLFDPNHVCAKATELPVFITGHVSPTGAVDDLAVEVAKDIEITDNMAALENAFTALMAKRFPREGSGMPKGDKGLSISARAVEVVSPLTTRATFTHLGGTEGAPDDAHCNDERCWCYRPTIYPRIDLHDEPAYPRIEPNEVAAALGATPAQVQSVVDEIDAAYRRPADRRVAAEIDASIVSADPDIEHATGAWRRRRDEAVRGAGVAVAARRYVEACDRLDRATTADSEASKELRAAGEAAMQARARLVKACDEARVDDPERCIVVDDRIVVVESEASAHGRNAKASRRVYLRDALVAR